ncbi:MAG: PH domain-containing protein [Myxococcales bacterium]|nr:PH domain-containing protein [Myxococcales bacterium]MCB9703951.1 PH domain-containing protein [Myxococcales bacterium]
MASQEPEANKEANKDASEAAPRAVAPAGGRPPVGRDEVFFAGIAKHSVSLGRYLAAIGASIVGGVLGWLLMKIDALAQLPLWLLALVGLPMLLVAYLRHITTRYKISARRVETEHGVITKRVDSLELWRVLDVRYEQSLLDRLFDNGKITLVSTDQTDPNLVLHGIAGHRELFEKLRDAVQTARMTSRPMELVGGHEAVELAGGGELPG